jgi:hypothetical protein
MSRPPTFPQPTAASAPGDRAMRCGLRECRPLKPPGPLHGAKLGAASGEVTREATGERHARSGDSTVRPHRQADDWSTGCAPTAGCPGRAAPTNLTNPPTDLTPTDLTPTDLTLTDLTLTSLTLTSLTTDWTRRPERLPPVPQSRPTPLTSVAHGKWTTRPTHRLRPTRVDRELAARRQRSAVTEQNASPRHVVTHTRCAGRRFAGLKLRRQSSQLPRARTHSRSVGARRRQPAPPSAAPFPTGRWQAGGLRSQRAAS